MSEWLWESRAGYARRRGTGSPPEEPVRRRARRFARNWKRSAFMTLSRGSEQIAHREHTLLPPRSALYRYLALSYTARNCAGALTPGQRRFIVDGAGACFPIDSAAI